MKRNIAIYAGTIAFLLAAGSPAFSQGSMEGGTPDSTMGKGPAPALRKRAPRPITGQT